MKIIGIKLKNILGISEMKISPTSNVIQVTGKNGQGKSSVIHGVLDALGVSSCSTLLRNGEKTGECVIDCEDILIRKAHTEKGGKLTIKGHVAGTKTMTNLGSPAKILKELVAPQSVDPVRLLTSTDKELVNAVLGAMPMVADQGVLSGIFGGYTDESAEGEHALVTIGNLTKDITDLRRDANRDHKTALTTMEQLQANMPDHIDDEDELLEQIEKNQKVIDGARSAARKAKRVKQSAGKVLIDHAKAEQSVIVEKIQKLERLLAVADHAVGVAMSNADAETQKAYEAELDKVNDLHEENTEINTRISKIGALQESQRHIDGYRENAEKRKLQSNVFTIQLEKLQKYKEELCSDLPIRGLQLDNGKLTLDGVPFDTLNTAKRVKVVIELAKLSSGDLGLVVLDNSEHLDSKTYAEFIKEAKKTDLQFLVARVNDEDLSVK